MIEEARRCYFELGIRGVKLVPDGWRVNDARIQPFLSELASLGMYVAFHCGIFLDERSSEYCRPASYEGMHRIPGFHGHLAHLGWPWVDECIATLAMETFHAKLGHKDHWQLKVDLSFGCPADWQVESFRKALNMLPHDMLMFGSDVFWPCDRQRYLEEFVYPQLATFEAAATLARGVANQGSHERVLLRRAFFHDNALQHWQIATRGQAQQPVRMKLAPGSLRSRPRPTEEAQKMRSPAINQPQQTMT